MINVLSISSDRKLFEENSSVRQRNISFGHLVDELHIIVFSLKELGLEPKQISKDTWIYPTNSSHKIFYILDAIRLGLKFKKIDLITTQDPFESGLVGFWLSKRLQAKLHIQIHTDFLSTFFVKDNLLNFLRVSLGKFILRKAHAIRVVSSRIKKSLKELNLNVIPDVLPVFIDPKKFEHNITNFDLHKEYPQFKNVVLSVSRLEKEKNIELALLSFSEVFKKFPDTGFIIVGEGGLKKDLINIVKKNNLEKNVIFVGWQEDTPSFYKSADIYFSTSNYEGYGISMLEAVLSFLPVVSTDVGVVGDVLVNNVNSIICPVGDKKCLSDALVKLMEDKDLRDNFKKNNKEIVQNLIPQFQYAYFENYRKSWLRALQK